MVPPSQEAGDLDLIRHLDLVDESVTGAVGACLAGVLRPGDTLLLEGPLGAGKTALARAIIRALTEDPSLDIPSPTFTLIQTYQMDVAGDVREIWHSDLYRLNGPEEVYDLGLDDIIGQGILLVEWPDRLPPDYRAGALHLRLSLNPRRLDILGSQDWRARLSPCAIILAAGRGTRMAHLTEHRPKPLVSVAGRALIDYALEDIRDSRAGPFCVVNIHMFADQMRAHLAPRVTCGEVVLSDESDCLLETGGGVKKALPLMAGEAIIILNSDVIRIDQPGMAPWIDQLIAAFDPAIMDVLLTIGQTEDAIGYPPAGDVVQSGQAPPGQPIPIRLRGAFPKAPYIFAAAMVVRRAAYDDTPDGAFSNLLLFERAQAAGRLFGLQYPGQVLHVGTPESLAEAERWFAADAASADHVAD